MNSIKELEQQEKYNKMLKRKNKEIERLNDIINKLDLYVRTEILKFAGYMTIEEYVTYFKELKGSDKE